MIFQYKKYQVIKNAISYELANFIFNYFLLKRNAVKFMYEKNITYDVFETDMGWVAIVGGDYGILRVSLPELSPESSLDAVQPDVNVAEHVPEDYVDAMHLLAQNGASENFIIASGMLHTVEEFVSIVFDYLGLNYKKYVEVNSDLITKKNKSLCGDITKIKRVTGWEPKITFEEMIIRMVDHYK